jgi:protein SCO1/2
MAGCGSEVTWQTKDISNLMPELGFTLTSEEGNTVTAEQFTDKVNLLFFGYTNCPDICPITLGRLSSVIKRLPPDIAGQVRVLFVSVDPKRDNAESLREYTSAFGENVVGLTGSKDQLDTLTRRYRTTYGYGEPDENGNYLVSHASAVYAFDTGGNARLLIRSDDSLEAIAGDIVQLVQG